MPQDPDKIEKMMEDLDVTGPRVTKGIHPSTHSRGRLPNGSHRW